MPASTGQHPPVNRAPRVTQETRYYGNSGVEYTFLGELGYGFGRNVCRDPVGEVYFKKVMADRNFDREREVLKAVTAKNCYHFPKFIDDGYLSTDSKRKFIIMELLGDNLMQALSRISRASGYENGFTDSTCLAIAVQTLNAIEELHYCGFVSRDIKPENFVYGRPPETGKICLLDFSISRMYLDKHGQHVLIPHSKFSGTVEYCSIAQQDRKAPSRVDDLEGWFYTMLYLFNGELDWHHLTRERSRDKKVALRSKVEVSRRFPQMMKSIMQLIDSFDRVDEPEYIQLYAFIESEMRRCKCSLDCIYDWEAVPAKNPNFLYFGMWS